MMTYFQKSILSKLRITHLLFVVVFVLFFVLIIVPIIYTVGTSLFTGSLLSYNLQLIDNKMFILLIKSCIIAFSVAIISTFIGTILGLLLYKTTLRYTSFFKIALLIPLFISPYIFAVAWKDFLFFFFGSAGLFSSSFGVVLVLVFIYTPLSMLIIGTALSNINSNIEDSGFLITKPASVIAKIILPLIKPALITSFVLVFIFSISEFSVPAFFGVKVFTTEIFTQFSAFYNHSLAILQSVILVIICVLLLLAEKKYISNAPFLSVGKKGSSSNIYSLKNIKLLSLIFVISWFSVSVILPFIILVTQSFKNGTDKFIQAFELLLPTFAGSIGLAFVSALIIVFISFIFAYYSVRSVNKFAIKSLDWILLIVFAIPSTVYGISLIKFYNQPMLEFIYSSYAIILIAYIGKFSFVTVKIISNSIMQIPISLEEAAQNVGVSLFKQQQKILIPLIVPTLFIAFTICFIFSFGELGTTIMLYPPGTEIVPIKVFTIMANAPQSLVRSMTLIVFSVTLIIVAGFYLIVKRSLIKTHFQL